MAIIKEEGVREAHFQYDAVKTLQISEAKAKITIEIDLAETVKALAYDSRRYNLSQNQLNQGCLAEAIAHQLDWQAYVLSTNDDHVLAKALADLNDN
jgi:hypothetical protein